MHYHIEGLFYSIAIKSGLDEIYSYKHRLDALFYIPNKGTKTETFSLHIDAMKLGK